MEIINVYEQAAPASRFIGRKYSAADGENGGYGRLWHEWFSNGWFGQLEALVPDGWGMEYPEAGSYIGLMRGGDRQPFEYWIGMFLPVGTTAPDGMAYIDLNPWHMGVCWVKGKEPEIYGKEDACVQQLTQAGFTAWRGDGNAWLMLEQYQCPRFTTEDSDGLKILDVVIRIDPPAQCDGQEVSAETGYCGACYAAFPGDICPECGEKGTALQADDPILIGMLPARLRNAMQIAFSATEIPFTAIPRLGSGFTMAAGDVFETYTVYAPYERAAEAAAAMESVLGFPPEKPGK